MTSKEVGKVTVLVLLVTMTCTFVAILIISAPDMNITRRSHLTSTGKLNFKEFTYQNITHSLIWFMLINPSCFAMNIHTIF